MRRNCSSDTFCAILFCIRGHLLHKYRLAKLLASMNESYLLAYHFINVCEYGVVDHNTYYKQSKKYRIKLNYFLAKSHVTQVTRNYSNLYCR